MVQFLKSIKNRLFFSLAHKSDLDNLYRQIEGLIQIQSIMLGAQIVRPMRGWAISPDAMSIILGRLQSVSNPTVIEFGAGQSTIVLGSFLKRHGGRLITVEHDSNYLQQIVSQVEHCDLGSVVEFVRVDLTGSGDSMLGKSYDLSSIPSVPIDLALVDGSPTSGGVYARFIPLDWSVIHLKPGGSVFLDDSNRPEEQSCKQKLLETHPTLSVVEHQTEKGLLEFIATKANCTSLVSKNQ